MDWRSNAAVAEIKLVGWVKMGVPYPDIANRLGTSVGAVCGKVHRMGIGRGPRKPDRLYLKAKKPRNPQLTPDAAYFEIMERQEREAEARQGLTVTLDTSDEHHCRYVIGDPTKRQLCGAQRVAGTPYCQEHAALCLSTLSLESRRTMGNRTPLHGSYAFYPNAAIMAGSILSRQAIDPRTFEEADAPEPVTIAA